MLHICARARTQVPAGEIRFPHVEPARPHVEPALSGVASFLYLRIKKDHH